MDLTTWKEWRAKLPPMDKEHYYDAYKEQNVTDIGIERLRSDILRTLRLDFDILSDEQLSEIKRTINRFLVKTIRSPALFGYIYDDNHEAFKILDPEGETEKTYHYNYASEFYIPWAVNSVPQSIALEVVYGYSVDFMGKMREIPPTDPSFYIAVKDALFAAIWERGIQIIEWLKDANPEKIAFMAAGWAPEFRHLGYKLNPGQEAYLYDNDTTINYDQILSELPFRNQIHSNNSGIAVGLDELESNRPDAMIASGIISYIWDQFPAFLHQAKSLIAPGGFLALELYPKHWEWERNRDIGGFYLPLKLFESVEHANDALFELAKAEGLEDIDYSISYDDFNQPIMIVYRIRMPA